MPSLSNIATTWARAESIVKRCGLSLHPRSREFRKSIEMWPSLMASNYINNFDLVIRAFRFPYVGPTHCIHCGDWIDLAQDKGTWRTLVILIGDIPLRFNFHNTTEFMPSRTQQ